ncbi:LuxR C-terminal-related transcriptional regulator [Chloroflexota bacterium]
MEKRRGLGLQNDLDPKMIVSVASMIDDTFKAGDSLVEPLTRRELEILSLLSTGLSNREIADQLTIALTTVKWYARQIYGKLGVNNRRQAAQRAKTLGLIEGGLPRHNLPSQPTPLVGRQKELTEISHLIMDPGCQLLTLTGPGGIGKTRLALAAAEDQITAQTFHDGIFFIPLAGLSEGERIVSVIAAVLQIRVERGESQLFDYLRAKQILLVLDNFEHLLESSDLVIRILQAAPQGKILITSRERLGLQSEQVYPLQGLPVGDKATMEDAGQLFLQAARRIRPDFQIATVNLPTLHHICHLVEGMPLALELAAAWAGIFTLEDIAVEIQRSLEFLSSDLRDMPSRHRSIQVVFDTTWQQLSIVLQQVLAAVAVFRGGFTREAATDVTEASMRDLAALVHKSLLSFDPNANRYHIHELLRQFCLTRLTDMGVRDRHCDYYLNWLVQQSPKLTGAEQEIALALIEREMDNIRAAINQALRSQRIDDFVLVMRTLGQYFDTHSRRPEAIALFDHIRTQLSAASDTPPRILFWATAWQVRFLAGLGHNTKGDQLRSVGQTYLADLTFQDSDIRAEQSFAFYNEGFRLYLQQPDKAWQLLQQSHNLALEIGDLWLAGLASRVMGLVARNQGDLDKARAAAAKCLSLFQTLNDRRNIVAAQILQGELARIDGRYEEAEQQLSAAITTARQYRLPFLTEYGLSKLQMAYIFSGQFKKARPVLAENLLFSEKLGYTWGVARNHICLGLLYLHEEGRYSDAQELGEKTLHMGREHEVDYFICEALLLLAKVDIALGNYGAAQERLQECVQRCPSRPVGPLYMAGNDLYWGIVAAAMGQTAVARQHLQAELETVLRRKDQINLANVLAAIALLQAKGNNAVAALENYALAQQHSFVANSRWYEDVVGRYIAEIAATLPLEIVEAAQKRADSIDLWETAEKLVFELREILS